MKLYGPLCLSTLLLFAGFSPNAWSTESGASGCTPPDFGALAVPSPFRAQIEFLHDKEGRPFRAGDAVLVRHNDQLKLVRAPILGSDPDERSIEGDEVTYTAKVGQLYVVQTVSYHDGLPRGPAGTRSPRRMDHLTLLDSANTNQPGYRYNVSQIQHLVAPAKAGELFIIDDRMVYVSRIHRGPVAQDKDVFKTMVLDRQLPARITDASFEELAGMPVLRVTYGVPDEKQYGELFFTYQKGVVELFESKGSHHAVAVTESDGTTRHFIINRYRTSRTGKHRTAVIEVFPDSFTQAPLKDVFHGSFTVDFEAGPVRNSPRFTAYKAYWSELKDGEDHLTDMQDALLVLPRPEDPSVQMQLTKGLHPFTETKEYGSALLLRPEVRHEDDRMVVFGTDVRGVYAGYKTPHGLVMLPKQDTKVSYKEFNEADGGGEVKVDTERWIFDLGVLSTHRVASVQREASFGGELLSVRFDTASGKSDYVLLIDPVTHKRVVIPGFQRAIVKTIRGCQYVFIFGRVGTTDRVAFTVYNASMRSFLYTDTFDTSRQHQGQPYFPEHINFNGKDSFWMPRVIAGRDIQDVEILEIESTSWVSFKIAGGERVNGRELQYLMDLNRKDVFVGLEDPRVLDTTGDRDYVVLAAKARLKSSSDSEEEVEKPPRPGSKQTALVFIPRKSGRTDYTLNGVPDELKFVRLAGELGRVTFEDRRYVSGAGVSEHLGGEESFEFRYDLRTDTNHVLVNKIATPLYEDSQDNFQIVATRGSVDSPPKLFLYRAPSGSSKVGEWQEIKLETPEQVTREVQVHFFTIKVSGIVLVPNTQQIEHVTRDGNFLFIRTAGEDGRAKQTYMYDLVKNEVIFSIPNLQKYVDVDRYRFYVGNSTEFNSAHVVVTYKDTGEKVESFDFGRSDLDIESADCIRHDRDRNVVLFKTVAGHTRVYDVKRRYFYGLLPAHILELLKPVENLGTVSNQIVFEGRGQQDALLGHNKLFGQLEDQFRVARTDTGSQYVMMIGESGSGRSIFLHEYISRYISASLQAMPKQQLVFFSLDPTSVTSDTKFRGTFADKFAGLRQAAQDLRKAGYRLVIMIDDMDNFQRSDWKDDEGDIFSQLKTLMKDGSFDVFATATPGGHEKLVRETGGMTTLFHTLRLPAMTEQETVEAIQGHLARRYPGQQIIEESLLRSLIDRIRRLQIHRRLPGSAFDVLKGIIRTKIDSAEGIRVTRQDVNEALARQSGVPAMLFDPAERASKLPQLEIYLKSRVQNQDPAIDAVVAKVLAFAMELGRSDWPILRAFFLGPTGVGKTELAKALSEFLFGDDSKMLKIMGPDFSGSVVDVRRLSKMMVDHVKRHPCNVILVDEFEKMHSEAQNIILGLGDGEITDETGRKVSTSLTIVIATSNLGAMEAVRAASHHLGFSSEAAKLERAMRDEYQKALEQELRPEVIARFDIIQIFNSLSEAMARRIVVDYLSGDHALAAPSIKDRLAAQGIKVIFDNSVIAYIMREYLDVRYGARRVASNLEQRFVAEFIAKETSSERMVPGKSYRIRYDQGKGTFVAEEVASQP